MIEGNSYLYFGLCENLDERILLFTSNKVTGYQDLVSILNARIGGDISKLSSNIKNTNSELYLKFRDSESKISVETYKVTLELSDLDRKKFIDQILALISGNIPSHQYLDLNPNEDKYQLIASLKEYDHNNMFSILG